MQPTPQPYVHAHAPRNVYWETTIACDLACQHCRAEAIPQRDPEELDHEQARALIREVKELGSLLVLTGGDPMKRPDLFELMDFARSIEQPFAITPSTTPTVTREVVREFRDRGVSVVGVSLDGPTPAVHDAFRGVDGTFAVSQNALAWAREFELKVQVNTTVCTTTLPHLDDLFELLAAQHAPPVVRWSLFVLVPTGRGSVLRAPSAEQLEELFAWVYSKARSAPFHISTVEAPNYRRFWLQQQMAAGKTWDELRALGPRMGFGMRDGNGVIFVARNGEVYPAGFLPAPLLGNVKRDRLSELYRHSPQLAELRDMDRLTGKCGLCEFRWLCGGSRGRAYATYGDSMAEEPLCVHQPGTTSAELLV